MIAIGVGAVGVVGLVAYLASRPSAQTETTAHVLAPPPNPTGLPGADSGNVGERVASGLLGIGSQITQGIFAERRRDQEARLANDRDGKGEGTETHGYDPVADYARKHA